MLGNFFAAIGRRIGDGDTARCGGVGIDHVIADTPASDQSHFWQCIHHRRGDNAFPGNEQNFGVVCLRKRGDAIERGEPLAEIHARDESAAEAAADAVLAAYEFSPEPPEQRPIVLDVLA